MLEVMPTVLEVSQAEVVEIVEEVGLADFAVGGLVGVGESGRCSLP